MKKYTKRGFTIVELVIVIAIVAILAGVLIPTFGTLIKKATISSDTQLVKNLNTILSVNEATDGKNITPTDAINDVYEGGYRIEKLTPTTRGYDIMWDSVNDKFVLLDDSVTNKAVIYGTDETKNLINDSTNRYKLFAIRSDNDDDIKDVYSLYLTGEGTIDSLDVTKGIDVGKNTVSTINYTNSNNAQNVIIRTNGGSLTINDTNPASHQTHYGYADSANISTGDSCFVGYGTISAVTLTTGKTIVKENGYIGLVSAATGTTVTEENGGTIVISSTATSANIDSTVAASIGYQIPTGKTTYEPTETKIAQLSTKSYTIGSKDELIAFRDAVNSGVSYKNITIKLTSDIDMSGYNWITPIGTKTVGGVTGYPFEGNFDGQGHSITNLSNGGYKTTVEMTNATSGTTGSVFGLFGYTQGTVNISNLNVHCMAYYNEGKCWAGIVGISGYDTPTKHCDLTISNCVVSGELSGKEKVAGFVGQSPYGTGASGNTTFNKCTNNATITASVDRAAGILAAAGSTTTGELEFTKCTNTGTITCGAYGAGICGNLNTADYTDNGCVNEGTITGNFAYTLFLDVYGTGTKTYTFDAITKAYNHCKGNNVSTYSNDEYENIWESFDTRHYLDGIAYNQAADSVCELTFNDNTTREFKNIHYAIDFMLESKFMGTVTNIKLMKDVTITEQDQYETVSFLMYGVSGLTLDLNDKTLTVAENTQLYCMTNTSYNLYIKNGNIVGNYSGVYGLITLRVNVNSKVDGNGTASGFIYLNNVTVTNNSTSANVKAYCCGYKTDFTDQQQAIYVYNSTIDEYEMATDSNAVIKQN